MYANPETLCIYGSARITPGTKYGGSMLGILDDSAFPTFLTTLEKTVRYAETRNVEQTGVSMSQLQRLGFDIGLDGIDNLATELVKTTEGAFRIEPNVDYRRAKVWHPLKAVGLWRALSAFSTEEQFPIHLDDYLTAYSKNVQFDISLYSLRSHKGEEHVGIPQHDTNYRLLLRKYGETIACIGFDIDDDGALMVKQIQGVTAEANPSFFIEALAPIRWEKIFLRILVDWDREFGFHQVRVQRAEDNAHYNPEELVVDVGDASKYQMRLKTRYNGTAKKVVLDLMQI